MMLDYLTQEITGWESKGSHGITVFSCLLTELSENITQWNPLISIYDLNIQYTNVQYVLLWNWSPEPTENTI